MGRNLAGDDHQRNRIHQRVGQAGHRIGRARPRGHQHATHLAGRARVAFGRVHRALLVAHQDVPQLVLLEQRVIDRQHRAARISEYVLDPLVDERLDHDFGAAHFLRHCSLLHTFHRRTCPENQKGARKPLRIADSRVALATLGDAPPNEHNNPCLGNKITHFNSVPSFPCADIRPFTPVVKPVSARFRAEPAPRRLLVRSRSSPASGCGTKLPAAWCSAKCRLPRPVPRPPG